MIYFIKKIDGNYDLKNIRFEEILKAKEKNTINEYLKIKRNIKNN